MKAKAFLAEFIGTFTLIFIGVGAGAAIKGNLTGVALAHGIAIAVMVSAFGAISGGHFNPSVSLGVWIGHKISTVTLISYWVAQCLGGIAAAYTIYYCIPPSAGVPALGPTVTPTQGFILEAIGAFFLTTVVYGTAVDNRAPKVGGLFIGLVITMCVLCFGTQTGSSINPARWLGPAVKEGNFANPVVYIVGPLVGGLIAGALYNYFFLEKDEPMRNLGPAGAEEPATATP